MGITVERKTKVHFVCEHCRKNKHNTIQNIDIVAKDFCDAIVIAEDKHKWHFESNGFSIRELSDVKNMMCPLCYEMKMKALQMSTDLREQISGGKKFTNDEFIDAALEYVGLTKHPKANKAFSMAWDHGHYLCRACSNWLWCKSCK